VRLVADGLFLLARERKQNQYRLSEVLEVAQVDKQID
jgi:hypothetical protein